MKHEHLKSNTQLKVYTTLTYDKYYNVSLQGVAYTPLFAQFLAYKALVLIKTLLDRIVLMEM